MTKIAILSDIHSNLDALTAVLTDVRAQNIYRLFICGDIAGYYYDTAAVWQALSEWDTVMCHGNHETILSDWIAGDGEQKENIRKRYGSSYRIASEVMDDVDIQTLLSLPHPVSVEVDGVRFLVSHGTPWKEDTYIYPDMKDEDRQRLFEYAGEADVICMGHTHYQMFVDGSPQIINPGSVGQPRSGKVDDSSLRARAQWAVYNTADRSCSLMMTMYDPSRIFAQVDLHDPHLAYLKSVLKRQEIDS